MKTIGRLRAWAYRLGPHLGVQTWWQSRWSSLNQKGLKSLAPHSVVYKCEPAIIRNHSRQGHASDRLHSASRSESELEMNIGRMIGLIHRLPIIIFKSVADKATWQGDQASRRGHDANSTTFNESRLRAQGCRVQPASQNLEIEIEDYAMPNISVRTTWEPPSRKTQTTFRPSPLQEALPTRRNHGSLSFSRIALAIAGHHLARSNGLSVHDVEEPCAAPKTPKALCNSPKLDKRP